MQGDGKTGEVMGEVMGEMMGEVMGEMKSAEVLSLKGSKHIDGRDMVFRH